MQKLFREHRLQYLDLGGELVALDPMAEQWELTVQWLGKIIDYC